MSATVTFSEGSMDLDPLLPESISSPESDETEHERSYKRDRKARKMSIFSIYARIFRLMLARFIRSDDDEEERRLKELDELILPSNEEWRQQVYYRLVDLQRGIDAAIGTKEMESESDKEPKELQEWEWEPGAGGYPLRPKSRQANASGSLEAIAGAGGSMTEACIEPGWRVNDLLLAAKVLENQKPPPTYEDESEMRRVFGLVYDVLRYKQILNHALEDVDFWYHHPECRGHERIVWLLLYDMQGRKFARRGKVDEVIARDKAFQASGLKQVEDALMETKTRLAASVSRLRISGSALTLGELLPLHLRNAKGVVWGRDGAVASGWVNTIKVPSKDEFVKQMGKLGLQHCVDCEVAELEEGSFMFDPLCPKVVNLHEAAREKVARSDLVRNHRFILLERSLCLGAAALAHAVRVGHLCGPVVLTHAIAPRHTGYLAGLLADVDEAARLLAFGTGERRREYETYLHSLGITLQQCRVYSEKYVSPPPSAELERATIILATPPCSYTSVRDAVDLAVARGGDTSLLESLTNVDDGTKQPQTLLTEQLTTLKHALTRPNAQLIIYEAHSELPAETTEMVEQVVHYANKMAAEKYIREHPPKKKASTKEVGGKSARSSKSGKRGQQQEHLKMQTEERRSVSNYEDDDLVTTSIEIKVPDSDLFELGRIDEICGESSTRLFGKGCYLAVVRRKEMMQFNSLFMIKVAETKGLFGDTEHQVQPKEEQPMSPVRQTSQTSRKGFKRSKIQMDRIAAPTHSSLVRSLKQNQACPRHTQHIAQDERIIAAQNRPSVPVPSSHPLQESSSPVRSPSKDSTQPSVKEIESQDRSERFKSQHRQEESVRRLSMPSMSRMVNPKDSVKIISSDDAGSFANRSPVPIIRETAPVAATSQPQHREADGSESVIAASQKISNDPIITSSAFQSYTDSALVRFAKQVGSSDHQNPTDNRNTTRNATPNVTMTTPSVSAAVISGSALGNSAVARAAQRIRLESVLEEPDKENLMRLPRSYVAPQKVSRVHHPGGPARFTRSPPGSRRLETVNEHTQGFSYLFPDLRNASIERGSNDM